MSDRVTRDLSGNVAIVTGAARGIGRGIVIELARAGAHVVVGDLDDQAALGTARDIEACGGRALGLRLDVMDADSVTRCVSETIRHFGRLDILVNNAGVFQSRLGFDVDAEEFNRCLDVNLTGMWRMVRACLAHFRGRGSGRIVNVASVGGRRGVDFAPAYCASKAGVINLTQSLASALGADSINVNAVCPGAVATAMQEQIGRLIDADSGARRQKAAAAPLPGALTAEDIGHAVVFLASDYASCITGQALNVDRGFLMS